MHSPEYYTYKYDPGKFEFDQDFKKKLRNVANNVYQRCNHLIDPGFTMYTKIKSAVNMPVNGLIVIISDVIY